MNNEVDKFDFDKEFKNLIETTLSIAEYTSANQYAYDKFRQKFLRLANNIIRRIKQVS